MNIISNNCLSGYLYKDYLKEEFGNPFIWTVIDFNSMLYLIQNWNNINFKNYELVKDKNWNFSIIIDNKVKIQYVHYKFNKNVVFKDKTEPGTDIESNKIWEYIIQKYDERLERMLRKKESPIFCICNVNTLFEDCHYNNEQLSTLQKYKNVYVLTGYDKNETKDNAKIFYEKFLNK